MSTYSPIPYFPLHKTAISDWLPKLGDKAFLAWLSFHSWKEEAKSPSPLTFPFSISQIIKRLKVGNSTFYNQILRPLWNHGLIDLKRIAGMNQFQIIVYLYPHNQPEKAAEPLNPTRNYDRDLHSHSTFHARVEITIEPEPLDQQKDQVPYHQRPSIPPNDDQDRGESNELEHPNSSPHPESPSGSQLPQELQEEIAAQPSLQERSEAISNVYHQCSNDPRFTLDGFIQKIHNCLRYQHDPARFASYLHKSLVNEWNRSPAQKTTPPKTPPQPKRERPKDVPEWVWRQQYEPQEEPEEITPEQKAIIDDLLRQLGEIP